MELSAPPKLGRQFTSLEDGLSANALKSPSSAASSSSAAGAGGDDEGEFRAQPLKRANPDKQVRFKYGMATDIGGGQTNQDEGDVFELDEGRVVVLAVYDGHGRELGELASQVARDSVRASLGRAGVLAELRRNSEAVLTDVFQQAHVAIRDAFRAKYLELGAEVQDTDEGYLLKRTSPAQPWTCTHGGTTATVVLILDGWRMIVANVGDSTALWGGLDAEATTLHRELSAEHSPESVEEFDRVRAFKPCTSSAVPPQQQQPDMRFVYDAPSFSKSQCPPIFDINDKGVVRVTGNGRYYKNVRSEWATLVTTPPTAKFQDALAFTRSLGDLHLHVYGVSCRPTVMEYDLTALHSLCGGEYSTLLVCTDGVWDNWKYADIIAACSGQDMVGLVPPSNSSSSNGGSTDGGGGGGGAQKATDRLMQVNLKRAKDNFGTQADNMTAILCYISF